MKRSLVALTTLLLVAAAGCGSSEEEDAKKAGARACGIYQTEMETSPEAIASTTTLATIKLILSELDDPTRRAFAALISTADANMFSEEARTVGEKAAEVRAVCLSEHGVSINN